MEAKVYQGIAIHLISEKKYLNYVTHFVKNCLDALNTFYATGHFVGIGNFLTSFSSPIYEEECLLHLLL